MTYFCSLLYAILLLIALPAQADAQPGAQQSHAEIHDAVIAFVRAQTRTLPGQVVIGVDEIDRRIARPACPTLETFLPPGSRLLGNSTVGVRCPGKKGWALFVPVQVKVSVDMLIALKPLPQGRVIQAEDLSSQNGELTQTGILTDPAQAIGKVLKNGIGAGQVLKQDMLRAPYAVMQGQAVQLQVEGAGFSIRSEGHALNNAAEGQAVLVKTTSGQRVSGTARPGGIVEIRP
jgi:flagella basal body P-ring formation protein FlgA